MKRFAILFLFLCGSMHAMENAFVQSKFLAEKQVESQAVQSGLPVGPLNFSMNFTLNNRNAMQSAIAKQAVPGGLSGGDPLFHEYITMQLDGNIHKLKKELATAKATIDKGWPFPMRYEKKQVATLNHLLSQPTMQSLDTIQNGSLGEAQQVLFQLQQTFQSEVMERELGTNHVTITELQLQSARELFTQRPDYNHRLVQTVPSSLTGQSIDGASSSTVRLSSSQINTISIGEDSSASIAVETVQNCDLVSTPAHSVSNVDCDVDARIEGALKYLDQANIAYAETHGKPVSFDEQMKAVGATLDYMKEQGLLTKSKDEFQEALWHGTVHFLKEFDPSSIVDNPRDFIINVTQNIAIATFHIMTDGMFLGADRAIALATQVHELYQVINRDYADLTPNQRAELIAERVADTLRVIFTERIPDEHWAE